MTKSILDIDTEAKRDMSTEIRFIDKYLCNYILNPTICTIGLIGSCIFIHGIQFYKIFYNSQWGLIFIQDYLLDLLQNIISLIFVLRFCMGWFGDIKTEVLLLVFENIGCINLVFNNEYSLLFTDISIIFKVFILWQILCPYFILAINLMDYMKKRVRYQEPKSLLNHSSRIFTLRELLIDTNNNFLPIFIAHSFIIINTNFPFVTSVWVIYAYKFSIFLLKFYCICRYILYETCFIIYNLTFVEYYNWMYDDVAAYNSSNIVSKLTKYRHSFLLSGISLCIGMNVLYILSFYLYVYL